MNDIFSNYEKLEYNAELFKYKIESAIVLRFGSVNKFCKYNSFNRANLTNWLNGKKDINFETFIKLIRYLELELYAQNSEKSIEIIRKNNNVKVNCFQ